MVNAAVREQLLGFLLGALDEAEMERVRVELGRNPHWRAALAEVRAAMPPRDAMQDDVDPPVDLAARTCDLVREQAERLPLRLAQARLTDSARATAVARSRMSMADFFVAAGICVAVALMFFPAISNSRHQARRFQCQNNLRQLGIALAGYSDLDSGGHFPFVPSLGNRAFAGIYAPMLIECGYLQDSTVLICPSSPLADSGEPLRIPSLDEIGRADPDALILLRRKAGGSYAYNLGIVIGGRHLAPRNQGRSYFALAGDVPSMRWSNLPAMNHGDDGLNLLFEDGNVRYLVQIPRAAMLDDPLRNRLGVVEAGIGEDDAVIAPSFSPPFQHVVSQPGNRR